MDELRKSFNKHLDKIREFHRQAQTSQGLFEVAVALGGLDIPKQQIPFEVHPDALLLEAIAKKVIPARYKWELATYFGGGAEIVLIGVKNDS